MATTREQGADREPGSGGGVFDAAFASHPQPVFRALRDESPVLHLPGIGGFGDRGLTLVSRYADVHHALRHPEQFSSSVAAVDIGQERPLIPLQVDPPDHARYRRILDPLFSPKAVAGMEEATRSLAAELIGEFADRGECDFHTEFAVPFPCTIFLRLMGLPLDELPRFLTWKDDIIRPPVESDDVEGAAEVRRDTAAEIYGYFAEVLDARSDDPGDDFVGRFLTAEVEGRRLSRDEILDISFLFLLGGLDTVTASLDCMIARLAQHPDERRRLAGDLSLAPAVVEELLRYETPVVGVPRLVTEDVEMAGTRLRCGDRAMLLLGAADTDDTEFERADEVDFDRGRNRHFAFGGGPHRCLGSHLARMELRVALEELHRRVPEYGLAPGTELEYTIGIRQVEELPLVLPRPEVS